MIIYEIYTESDDYAFCYEANSLEEALGKFFKENPTYCYNDIIKGLGALDL